MKRSSAHAIVAAAAISLLAACGSEQGKSATSQVAARVNSDEITVHQLNGVLRQVPKTDGQPESSLKERALERLIEQQLAVQQALRRKLDRAPEVVAELEAARADILARAFAAEIARQVPKPTSEEVGKYFRENPQLFAERRLYQLEEIALPASFQQLAELKEVAVKARSIQDVGSWLRAAGTEVSENRGVRAAEMVPLEILPEIHKMKDGEIRVMEHAGRAQVLRLVAAKPSPVDQKTAEPRIQQYLFNRRVSEALAKEMKDVKQAAKIEYRGEFAKQGEATAKKQ